MIGQIWEVIGDLWNTGNRWARLAIISVFLPPFAALVLALFGLNHVAAFVALVPLLALVFVPLSLIDPLVIGVAAVALGLAPTGEAIRQWLARWIPLYVGSVLALGVYLFFVPVGNNPVLAIPLVASVGGVAAFAASGSRGAFVRWATRALSAVALGVTIAFFFSGKAEKSEVGVGRETATEVAETPLVEEFVLDKGQEFLTVVVGPDTMHVIQANKPWVAVVRATGKEYQMSAGKSCWKGGGSQGLLRVKGLEDGTTLRFEERQKT